jgi:PAS domain S-box-containing protein
VVARGNWTGWRAAERPTETWATIRHAAFRYGAAVLATALALIAQLLVWPYVQPLPFIVFFGAVMFSGWQGGWGPGLLAIALSALAADYFFLHPQFTFSLSLQDLFALGLFMLVSTFLTALNVSVRKGHQQAREHEEWLSTTLRSIGDGVIATDAAGRIVFLNPVAEALTQWSQREARGRPLNEVFHIIGEHAREERESPVAKVLREGKIVGLANSTLLIRKDGTELPIDDSGAPIWDEHGRIRGVVLVFRDVTGKKHRETERAHLLQETQAAVRVRDEFLSVASHELKTPLTPLQLRLDSLEATASSEPSGVIPAARVIKDVKVAQRQVRRLAELVESLLDVSRLSTGRLQLRLQEMDLTAVAREMVSQLQQQAQSAGCEVRLEVVGPICGMWDPLRLEQVVTNLLTNAFKYGAGTPIHLRVWAEAGKAKLQVRDQGIGIDPVNHRRIFGMFERAVSDRHYGGLGLGLYITRQIVESMGGTIYVDSEPGQGATFTVELLQAPPQPSPATEEAHAIP